ncbi:DNA primase [Sphingomonas sp. LT1P40]|uniref:DNA primase n=1 Tax=Alteristakelama amylovorans TaxID=3096166 RepID=UPI002FC6AEAF
MGGHQVPGQGSGDDGYDEDGYDESQRAEILEATRSGPGNGIILTDLNPDLGEEIDADDDEDELAMTADEGSSKITGESDEDDDDEDDAQDAFEDGTADDEDLDDDDAVALNP